MFDVITYGTLVGKVRKAEQDSEAVKSLVRAFPSGYSFKGTVASVSDLPGTAEVGDLYVVTGDEDIEYVWNGTSWFAPTNAIPNESIDTLY